jgi:hypothetical protein
VSAVCCLRNRLIGANYEILNPRRQTFRADLIDIHFYYCNPGLVVEIKVKNAVEDN